MAVSVFARPCPGKSLRAKGTLGQDQADDGLNVSQRMGFGAKVKLGLASISFVDLHAEKVAAYNVFWGQNPRANGTCFTAKTS